MMTYLKHVGGKKHSDLKTKSFEEIKALYDKIKRSGDSSIAIDDSIKGEIKEEEGTRKRKLGIRKKMKSKKRKFTSKDDEELRLVETEGDSIMSLGTDVDLSISRFAEMEPEDSDVNKSRWKFQEILFNDKDAARNRQRRLGGSLEDSKDNNSDIKPEDESKRVLWGDLKVMFEPDKRSDVWRILQGYWVTIWKLIDSSRVHFVRFDIVHIFMLVEKRYPLTPITIINMLNKKLQIDHQNKMCYQLLKLMVKQQKGGRGKRTREGNDERVDELNGQGNDHGIGSNRGVEGANGNVEGANGGTPNFSMIIAQQLHILLPTMLAQACSSMLCDL
ncbi:hypothetical protein Tco_0544197 [Tanacetum coccineum]